MANPASPPPPGGKSGVPKFLHWQLLPTNEEKARYWEVEGIQAQKAGYGFDSDAWGHALYY